MELKEAIKTLEEAIDKLRTEIKELDATMGKEGK